MSLELEMALTQLKQEGKLGVKLLEKEFVCNYDKRGDNTFKQIKRNEHAAIYQRFNMDGRPLEFEVFQIRVAGGGDIFGRHYDKYEQYPGAAVFGKTAWTVTTFEKAEEIFNKITADVSNRSVGEVDLDNPSPTDVQVRNVGHRRGRRKVNRPAITFPKKKFSMKDLAKLNVKGWTQPTLYVEVTKLLKSRKLVEAERVSQGRGRATVYYKVV